MLEQGRSGVGVHWFRHGLRLHDNPALVEVLCKCEFFIPIFIFDGHSGFSGSKKVSHNRLQFLLECLIDLNSQLGCRGGRLYVLQGDPAQILARIQHDVGLDLLSFDEDYEPIWQERDERVRQFCNSSGVRMIERGSHTLWDPRRVIETNGGVPPLTYQMFLHTVKVIGPPPRPVADINWQSMKFGNLDALQADNFKVFQSIPRCEDLGVQQSVGTREAIVLWEGGETRALRQLDERVIVEAEAFKKGLYLPNQAQPDLLAPPTSLSAALSTGCLSVRRFYWLIHDLYRSIHPDLPPPTENITGQLIWREYFYTMSVDNPRYGQITGNPICLDIGWRSGNTGDSSDLLERWRSGNTGYPFIDATMRQLKQEGWIHHVSRNAVACFLTRGDLWITWEAGLAHFLEQLIDADWSVCAGNWLWVSSSAFEQLLDCSQCVCPVNYGRRLDPWGQYVKRYVPEVRQLPVKYIYEPWKASLEEQERANCVIGRDYPERVVVHQQASKKNRQSMLQLRSSLMESRPQHCRPSSIEEVRQFMWLPEKYNDHACEVEHA